MLILFFVLFFLLLVLNVPIVFCMLIPSILYIAFTPGLAISTVIVKFMGGVDASTLLCLPLFILAGNIMNMGAVTDRIFGFAHIITRHKRGGLGYANILASLIFAGMSGSACADAGSLGAIELKAMREHGYNEDFSLAVTGGSSILGPIFPPSMPMTLVAFSTGLSLGKLFAAGIIPAIVLAIVMMIKVFFDCKNKNYQVDEKASKKEIWDSFRHAFPCLMMPVMMLVGIYSGVFTPTETAAVISLYSLILAAAYKCLNWENIKNIITESVRSVMMMAVICASSTLFAYILALEKVPQKLVSLFTGHINSQLVFWIIMIIFFLILGCFLDDSVSELIIIPMLIPVAQTLGIDPIHFVIIAIILTVMGLATPPVGMVLYMLEGVSSISYERIAKAVIPYLIAILAGIILLILIPACSTWLPGVLF